MGALIRGHDWASTALGPPEGWPQSLRTVVRLILNTQHPMSIVWGAEGLRIYNDACRPLIGTEGHPGSLGRPMREFLAETWHLVGPQIEQVMSGGQAIWQENALVPITREGVLADAYWTYSFSPIDDESAPGGVGGVLVIFNETTKTVAAFRRKAETEERLELALSVGNGIGTWDWDVPGDRVFADARFARMYGVDPAQAAVGVPIEAFFAKVHAEDLRGLEAQVEQALQTGEVVRVEYRLVQPDGDVRWVASEGQCKLYENGHPIRFAGVAYDITERRRVRDALSESEARYRTLFDTVGSGFCIIEMKFDHANRPIDYMIVEGNAAFSAMTGLHDVNGKWVSEVAPGLEQHWFDLYGQVALTGEGVRFENPADVFGRWYDVEALPVGQPETHRVAILFNDITARKQAERRQDALIDLTDQFSDLTDPGEIAYAGASILAAALGATRAGYGLIDRENGTIDIQNDYRTSDAFSLTGLVPFADYGTFFPQLLAGEAVVIDDVTTDPRTVNSLEALRHLGVASTVNIPLIEQGVLVAIMYVGDERPRHWTPTELALMREITVRVRAATERARESSERAESEIRYRALFNAMDEGFAIFEFFDGPHGPLSDFIHLEANPAYAANAGLTDIVGRTVREMIGDEAQGWIDLYGEVLRTGRPMRFERELVATGRWLELAAFRVEPASRNQVAVIFKDLTARKQAEMALRESEAQFRAFAQAVPNHVWASHPDGHLYWFNEQVYAYAGVAEGALDGKAGWGEVVHPDDLPGAGAKWAESLATGEVYHAEFRIRRADGEWRWFVVRAEPVLDSEGAIIRWVGANIDIEDIRRQQAELERVNDLLSDLLAGSKAERDRLWTLSQDMLARADYAGGLLAVNPAWTQTLGWSEDELLTNPYADIINPDDLKATTAKLEEMSQTGLPTRLENRILSKDGQWTSMGWTLSPETDGVHFIAVGRDLTEDKSREQLLAQAEEALRQSQKMEAVGQLTGGIAHDFNNLLAGISGSLELLAKRLDEGRLTGVERFITAAQGSADRAATLTQRLLAFSRRQTLDPRAVDVNRLVADMEDLIRRTVGPTIEVEFRPEGDLWSTKVDVSQLENALLNLSINARDAMAPNGGRLTIETANKVLDGTAATERDLTAGEYVHLCVSDTGTGMPPEVIEKAFDPFFTTKPIGQGTGLGLSMIHGFVRQSGGQVRITSTVGEGTTMCLYLPRHTGPLDTPDERSAPRDNEIGQGETVLVIDDERAIRMLLVEMLTDSGYRVLEAEDGPGGLAILRSDAAIDLLITDVGLPGGLNGRQVADAARASRPDLKVLFVTGYAENALVGNGHLDAGMEVLTKPFVLADLGDRIRKMLETRPAPEFTPH
jgi:PAS domain S-box-containing protein